MKKWLPLWLVSLYLALFVNETSSLLWGSCALLFTYSLFWVSLAFLQKTSSRVASSLVWTMLSYLWSVRWLCTTEYHGRAMLLGYFLVVLIFSVPTALCFSRIGRGRSSFYLVFVALFEVAKLWIVCGFPFNPLARLLLFHPLLSNLASLGGVGGLVLFFLYLNYTVFLVLIEPSRCRLLGACAFLVGGLFLGQGVESLPVQTLEPLSVLMVQTGARPEEKNFLKWKEAVFQDGFTQWESVLDLIESGLHSDHPDLIVLPEAVNTYDAREPLYTFGQLASHSLSDTVSARLYSNLDIAGRIARKYQTYVLANLYDREGENAFCRAFLIAPDQHIVDSYDKKMLVPIAEYIPFSFLKRIAGWYDIGGACTAGERPTVFDFKTPFGVSICYEEGFGYWLQKMRRGGAKLFINLSNDGWFPDSNLPYEHELLGKLRSIENGICSLRVTNHGSSVLLDERGQALFRLPYSDASFTKASGVVTFTPRIRNTLYGRWGEMPFFLTAILTLATLAFFKKPKFRLIFRKD